MKPNTGRWTVGDPRAKVASVAGNQKRWGPERSPEWRKGFQAGWAARDRQSRRQTREAGAHA